MRKIVLKAKYIFIPLIFLTTFLSFSSLGHAANSGYLAAESPDADAPTHGILIITHFDNYSNGYYSIGLNTDTLLLNGSFNTSLFELGAQLKAETTLAGLLPDYILDGSLVEERGFNADLDEAKISVKTRTFGPHYFEIFGAKQKWGFSNGDKTSEHLTLPESQEMTVVGGSYTLWSLENDETWSKPHLLYPQPRGYAFGAILSKTKRDFANAWGALDETSFTDPDLRNSPELESQKIEVWALAGQKLGTIAAVETKMFYGRLTGGDDIDRFRVGGLNPYVVPLGGHPWASFLSDQVRAIQVSVPVYIVGDSTMGPNVDIVQLDDIHRSGSEELTVLSSYGFVSRFKYNRYNFDLRASQSSLPESSQKFSGIYFGCGSEF